jgi:hypothetical protein
VQIRPVATLVDSDATGSPGIDLLWIPLGSGGSGFVDLNGRIYEAIKAYQERRPPVHLYHTALQVHVPEGRFVVETVWPSPDANTGDRGVALEGPVFAKWLAPLRTFRYEVRCWRNGVVPDAECAVAGPQRLTDDAEVARRLLDLAPNVPPLTWGRDQTRAGDMWNSNSVISWLLTRSGLPMETIRPPEAGRAPGWQAGLAIARQHAPVAWSAATSTDE